MTTIHRFRVATALTAVGLVIIVFWRLIARFFIHTGPRGGLSSQLGFLVLASAAVATLACGGAIGLAVPLLLRDPALRTPTRIASSIAAAVTALLLLTFWVRAFPASSGVLSYLLFVGFAPGILVLLIVRAARRFRAESSRRRAILFLAIALLALWAVASTVNFFVLWADPETHGRVMNYLTLTYAAFGSGLVMVIGKPSARGWALVVGTALVYVAIVVVAVAA